MSRIIVSLWFRVVFFILSILAATLLGYLFYKDAPGDIRDLHLLFLFYGLSAVIYSSYALYDSKFMKSELLIGAVIAFIIMFLSYLTVARAETQKEWEVFHSIFYFLGIIFLILEALCCSYQHPKEI